MSNTADVRTIAEGMRVYGADEEEIGTVERREGDDFFVAGHRVPASAIARVDLPHQRVYLRGTGAQYTYHADARGETVAPEAETRIPLREEELHVEKRPTELGEVQIHKTVTETQQSVPVDLQREEVHVERHDVDDRPVADADRAFKEETIRVPVRGEEPVVTKQAVVTGEVVVEKQPVTERQQVSGTVRREEVETDKSDLRTAAGEDLRAERTRMGSAADATTGRTADNATAARSTMASADTRATDTRSTAGRGQVREGADVIGADGQRVGRVKEVRDADVLVDRSGQRDVYVPLSAVTQVTGREVRLNVDAGDVDNQGWRNPPLV